MQRYEILGLRERMGINVNMGPNNSLLSVAVVYTDSEERQGVWRIEEGKCVRETYKGADGSVLLQRVHSMIMSSDFDKKMRQRDVPENVRKSLYDFFPVSQNAFIGVA